MNNKFKHLYWMSFVSFINHFYPDDGTDVQSETIPYTSLPTDVHLCDDTSEQITSSLSSSLEQPHFSKLDSLTTSTVEIDPFVTMTIDCDGKLVPKPSLIADYTCRPEIMRDMSLWDFLSLSDKYQLPKSKQSTSSQNGDNEPKNADDRNCVDSSSENDCSLDGDEAIFHPLTSSTDSLYLQYKTSFAHRFRSDHPEHVSHALHVLPYSEKYVLVPLGPPLPRFDHERSREAYCRLMLILFKPWISPTDLKPTTASWTESFSLMMNSEAIRYEHKLLMDNIHFLHHCRDDQDKNIKERAHHHLPHDDSEHHTLETDFTDPPDVNELSLLQHKHEHLLADIQQQALSITSTRDNCLNAIALAGFSNCDHIIVDAGQFINDTLLDLTSMQNTWKSEYNLRRKAIKEELHSLHSTSLPMSDDAVGVTSISQMDTDSVECTQIMSNGSTIVRQLDNTPSNSTTSFSVLSNAICNQWTLNSDQRRAFLIVAQHAFDTVPSSSLSMLISGPAGSGKSQVLSALRDLFSLRKESRRLRCTSYMGIAANNISGVTLHSALNLTPGLSFLQSPSNKSIEELKYMWTGVDYLFIDEVSMISCEFLHVISVTLTRATGKSLPFGGVNVIFAGDLAQLPPVAETCLSAWLNPKQTSASDRSQRKLKGKILWLSITTVVILQKINRQSGTENERFVDLLSRLREGCCTSADYNLLNSRVISVIRNINQWKISIKDFAPVIVCDNTTKDAVNLEIPQVFASKTGQPFCTYTSVDEIDGAPITDPNVLKIIELIHSGRTSNKLKDLPLAFEMPVMITTNVDLVGGIVNGSIDSVRSIDFTTLSNGNRVLKHCIVHIPSAHAAPMNGLADHEFPILPDTNTVRYQGSRLKHFLSFKQTQLPLIPAFAMTAHKSQGQTIQKAIIDLATCRGTEPPYVMVSRVRKLEDLLILHPFPIGKITCRMSEDTR
jgi:PIF1-like helicase